MQKLDLEIQKPAHVNLGKITSTSQAIVDLKLVTYCFSISFPLEVCKNPYKNSITGTMFESSLHTAFPTGDNGVVEGGGGGGSRH